MDTLPRLMASDPQLIQPKRLAEGQERLTGELSLVAFERLKGIISRTRGQVAYHLAFNKNEEGYITIVGELDAVVTLTCQRCLKPMEKALHSDISVAIVANKAEAERLPPHFEPLILIDGQLSLLEFIEDEVLLCLPMAPMHASEDCPAGGRFERVAQDKYRPFAALKDLNLKKSKS